MDEDEDYTIEPLPAVKMQGIDVLILALDAVSTVVGVPSRFISDVNELLCKHANWRLRRASFAEEAALEIERLVSGE